ncbi:DUF4290 domain-containing protein [bacterium SCSIO 12643]|nr:DUF4290 domain-containing protein [bacterium SCSIO 12643]
MEYNTERKDLILPEYGRNVHQMVDYLIQVEDREERNTGAKALIKLMGQLNPQLRDVEDYNHKLWDHLFIMSNFMLDVDSPYPIPSKEEFESKPNKVEYPQGVQKYRHYGKVITTIIEEAAKEEDAEQKDILALMVGNLMKKTYLQWNKNTVDDLVIWNHLLELSNGKLSKPEGAVLDEMKHIVNQNTNTRRKGNGRNKKRRY